MNLIEVEHLCKSYTSATGFLGLRKQTKNEVPILKDLSFKIKKGEIVAYLGSNGAGKSTTIKILSGVLHPTGGKVLVNGRVPYKERKKNVKNIGVLFGSKTQLLWDLPLYDSFDLLASIYGLSKSQYIKRKEELIDFFNLSEFINQPVRQLSLGQRMRGDLAAALIHSPQILFLDEPTIGLDIVSKNKIQQILLELNQKEDVTIILTTHNLDDIERLCKRIIFIDKGIKIFDGDLTELFELYRDRAKKTSIIEFNGKIDLAKINKLAEVINFEQGRITVRYDISTNFMDIFKMINEDADIIDIINKGVNLESILLSLQERR